MSAIWVIVVIVIVGLLILCSYIFRKPNEPKPPPEILPEIPMERPAPRSGPIANLRKELEEEEINRKQRIEEDKAREEQLRAERQANVRKINEYVTSSGIRLLISELYAVIPKLEYSSYHSWDIDETINKPVTMRTTLPLTSSSDAHAGYYACVSVCCDVYGTFTFDRGTSEDDNKRKVRYEEWVNDRKKLEHELVYAYKNRHIITRSKDTHPYSIE